MVSLLGIVALVSAVQPFDMKASMERGKALYMTYCLSCHMMQGEGVEGVFPPLVKNPNMAQKERMVQVLLKGMRGPVTVNGKTYDTEMAPTVLTDQEAADLINYMRNAWGNKASPVLPKDIQPALKLTLKNYKPY